MTAKSSFLPRLSFSRGDSPVLPFHNTSRSSLRNKRSEYDLADLSPRAEEALLSPEADRTESRDPFERRRPSSTSAGNSEGSSKAGSTSKMKHDRVMFAGPPPPIATSKLLYTDEEDRAATLRSRGSSPAWLPTTAARNAISSVIWDHREPSTDPAPAYDRDSVWRSLQRRQLAIEQDLQRFLNIQEQTHSARLDPTNTVPSLGPLSDTASDTGSATPTGTNVSASSRRLRSIEPIARSTAAGEIIPVRQPRARKLGLTGARRGLAKSMALLADLKAEEDASLASALSTRKKALAQIRKLSARREGISEELRALETDDEEPLTRELSELDLEHRGVCTEISDLEERLAGLKKRRRWLEGRIDDVKNRREAGLSGYKGALKEVEDNVKAVLSRPPVKPLDLEALRMAASDAESSQVDGQGPGVELPLDGVEFLRLRPERRTIDMAKEWWEGEVTVLERRKAQVDKERAALEDGAEVWDEVVKLVSDFETDFRKTMQGPREDEGLTKGKHRPPSPEEALQLQAEKIQSVITGLEQRLVIAEQNHWNLLIAAIGAEFEAFKAAEHINKEMLRSMGIGVERSPSPLKQSYITAREPSQMNGSEVGPTLVDVREDKAGESDNEVPPDLLVAHDEDGHRLQVSQQEPDSQLSHEREDSENEVPPEFLAEHHGEDDDVE